MGASAVALVAVAAIFHAAWNALAKRGADKLAFLWWVSVAGTVLFALPVVLWSESPATWPAATWWRLGFSAGLRAAYFYALGAAYARGDLSLVYPLARGTAPVLVPVLAIVFLGEALAPGAVAGVAAVTLGVYILHLPRLALGEALVPLRALRSPYAGFALLSGLATAAYSVVDKWNMASGIPPVWYVYLTVPVAGLLLTPVVLARRAPIGREWAVNRWPAAAGTLLMVSGYLMIILALRHAPVSYVAPARELSIVYATLFGAVVLREGHAPQRVAGAVLIALGVVLLAVSPRPAAVATELVGVAAAGRL